jgi:hypothetical protein
MEGFGLFKGMIGQYKGVKSMRKERERKAGLERRGRALICYK